eukprot:c17322_g1_i1 orf=133-903(-)
MQSWYSMGFMAPSFCKIFVSFKSKKLSRLILVKRKKKRTYGEEVWNVCSCPPESDQHRVGGGEVSVSPMHLPRLSEPRRHSNYQGSPPRSSGNYIMGRNSDVTVGLPARLSTSSSSGYERLSVEYHQGGGLDLPPLVKLGALSDGSSYLVRQDSAMSAAQHRHSSCSATSFVSSTSSRLRGAYARQRDLLLNDTMKKQPHIGELFAGNQFLTHLTSAPPVPASPCAHTLLQPSSGLVDASLRYREADLKDRIILFL